jgi:hypothetical protein
VDAQLTKQKNQEGERSNGGSLRTLHDRAREFFDPDFRARPGNEKKENQEDEYSNTRSMLTLHPTRSSPRTPVWVRTLAIDFSKDSNPPGTSDNSPAVRALASEHDAVRSRGGESGVQTAGQERELRMEGQ